MPRKPKFKPVIARIKLNPEQAVLACTCFDTALHWYGNTQYARAGIVHACQAPPAMRIRVVSGHQCSGLGSEVDLYEAGASVS
jgi:hypothetical protein